MWRDSETNIDYLNFNYLVDVITEMVTDKDITPSTIGVYGDWGSGKSSIMKMVEEKISKNGDQKVIFVHFNGWLFEGYEDAKTALCGTILETIAKESTLGESIRRRAKALLKKVDVQKLLGKGVRYGLDFFLTGGIGTLAGLTFGTIAEALKEKAGSMSSEDFEKLFKQFKVENEKRTEIKDFQGKFAKLIDDSKIDNLIVFIDELDRCEPDTILDIFSAMRLFLFAKGTSFVIGADERLIQYAIKTKYREVPGNNLDISKEYLEKVIQYPVNIPILSHTEVEQYLSLLLLEKELGKEDFKRVVNLIQTLKPTELFNYEYLKTTNPKLADQAKEALDLARQISFALSSLPLINGNPRQCKRFLNTLQMRLVMASSRSVKLKKNVVAKLMLLEYYKPHLYDKVIDSKNIKSLIELESVEKMESVRDDNIFKEFLEDNWFSDWLKIPIKLSEENLAEYYYFSRKSSRLNMSIINNLSPTANKCLELLKTDSDSHRNQGLELIKDISTEERLLILSQLGDDMNVGEKIDAKLFESFCGMIEKDPALKTDGLAVLDSIPVTKYEAHVVANIISIASHLTQDEIDKFKSKFSSSKELTKAFEGILKIKNI